LDVVLVVLCENICNGGLTFQLGHKPFIYTILNQRNEAYQDMASTFPCSSL